MNLQDLLLLLFYTVAVSAGVIALFRSPELRHMRVRFLFSILLIVGFWLVWSRAGLGWTIVLAAILLRPIITLCAFAWAELLSHLTAIGITNTLGGDSSCATLTNSNWNLPREHRRMGRHDLAIAAAQEKLAEDPESFEGLYLIASIHAEDRRDLPHAYPFMLRILRSNRIPTVQKEVAYARWNDWAAESAAQGRETPALEIPAGSTLAPIKQGIFLALDLRAQGKWKDAVIVLEKHLKKLPSDFEARLLMAALHAQEGASLRKAEKWISTIVSDPQTPPMHKELAQEKLAIWKDPSGPRHSRPS